MKLCPRCEVNKADEDFHKSSRDGLQTYCKACSREIDHRKYLRYRDRILEHNRAWSHANLDKVREWERGYRDRARGSIVLKVERRRARKAGLPATLTAEEWDKTLSIFGSRCAYCGADGPLEQDHFFPVAMGGGYEVGNILPACPHCNKVKWQKSPLDFLGLQKYEEILTRIHAA